VDGFERAVRIVIAAVTIHDVGTYGRGIPEQAVAPGAAVDGHGLVVEELGVGLLRVLEVDLELLRPAEHRGRASPAHDAGQRYGDGAPRPLLVAQQERHR
jgi:hypothetical protein